MTTRDAFDVFVPLREAVGRFLDEGGSMPDRLMLLGRTIPVDVIETEDGYIIEASLTGIKPDNVHVSATDTAVTIRVGHRGHPHMDDDSVYIKRERYERHAPEMTRTITLPAKVDAEKVTASYEHGVLTVHVAKAEDSKPRAIPLHVTKTPVAR